MAETQQNWRSKWDEECPLTIGVALQNWESWSDSVLRDELKRIRETGFQTVRVTLNRDTDIEKSPGMMNWRNPDRFFDAAEQAGLKIWCAPGNDPHHSFRADDDDDDYGNWKTGAFADVIKWIQRFVRQYKEHPALLAWVVKLGSSFWSLDDADFQTGEVYLQARNQETDLLHAFFETDPDHPVLKQKHSFQTFNSDAISTSDLNTPSVLHGFPGYLRNIQVKGNNELDRSLYAEAKFGVDTASPAWPVLYDCTGGSTNYGSANAFTMTAGKMTRILLIALAAGLKSVWFDQWHTEFLDWLDRVTPSAQAAGHISQAVERYHQEIWHSQQAPQVQVSYNLDASTKPYLGIVRALSNGNIPFAFITDEQLLNDKAAVTPILFLTGSTRISETLLIKLKTLVEKGTRLVTEVPTGFCNDKGDRLNTLPGSPFEQLFGVSIAGMFYADPPNPKEAPTPAQLRAQIVTTTARAGGGSGEVPAFTENRVGKGRALLINLPLSQINATENLPNAQLSLLSYILGSRQTELPGLTGCLQFRRTSQNAEHVFLINDSAEERTVSLSTGSFTNATDVLADTALSITEGSVSITVPAGSGIWIRLATS